MLSAGKVFKKQAYKLLDLLPEHSSKFKSCNVECHFHFHQLKWLPSVPFDIVEKDAGVTGLLLTNRVQA